MTLHQFLLALRGRLWIFLSIAGAAFATAAIVTFLMPKTYEATVSLLVDNRDEQSLTGSVPSARERIGFMQTQVDIIQSQGVARQVVRDLKLASDPAGLESFAQSYRPGTYEDYVARGLLERLKVDTTQSSVITITYAANDAKKAAAVANGFAKAYMDMTLHLRTEPTRQAAGWFDEQLKGLRKTFEDAQHKLTAYQKEKGIIATDERVDVEVARLNELSTQALQAQASTFESASRSNLKASADSLPEVIANPLIQTLKAQLLTAEAALSEMGTRLGPAHPQMIQQQQQVNSLRSRLGAETSRVVAGSRNTTAQNQARQASLQQALEQQRNKVIALREARGEAFVLMREVETAQKAYEAALSRYLVNKVESGARQTNVAVLTAASEPARHTKPKTLLNLVLGLVVGTLLGLGTVFLLELLDRRVRSGDDLEIGLDAPLLATLQPWRPSPVLGGPSSGGRALPSPA